MSNAKPSISACFPAYNEGGTVYAVVRDAHAILSSVCDDFEIVVCNDGSKDDTLAELRRLEAELPQLRLLDNGVNRGLAFTFARLYAEARKDLVFLNATDGQWRNSILREMVPLAADHDIVVTVRREKHYGHFRSLVSGLYNGLPRLAFGVRTRDAGGVKLIARKYLYVGRLVSRSPFADAERLIRAVRDGARVAYVPVEVRRREAGKSNAMRFSVLLACGRDFLRLWHELVVARRLRRRAGGGGA